MTIVAVLAVVMCLGVQSLRFRARSKYHDDLATSYAVRAFLLFECGSGDGTDELLTVERKPGGGAILRPVSSEAERMLNELANRKAVRKAAWQRLEAYHDRYARKFEGAVLRPWTIVTIDPPPPEPE
jgi:hypothetical protein